jgi:tetratricopeptide (TPR) repeat protein
MRRALIFCWIAVIPSLMAADHWVRYTSGPFEVLTDAGEKAGQETLVHFEEFRHALGTIVGEDDLQTPQPVRILVFKNSKGWTSPSPLTMGRDRYAIVLGEKSPVTPEILSSLTRLLLDSNTNRMPAAFEHGLVEFFSTLQVNGIHIAVGAPPPQPDLDWARVHLLVTAPEFFGKLRILLYNLRKGVDDDPAYQNAFGKPAAEVEAMAKRHFAAGNFQTSTISSLPMAPGDFHERAISDTDVRLARADLLAGEQSAAEYRSLVNDHLKVAESEEGLGLLALRDRHNDEARGYFASAMESGSTSARCYIEYARLESDDEKADKALLRAAGINPKLDEPFAMMAQRDTDPLKRLAHWKAAAERDPRNASYWQALAECYLADHNFGEAAKAWREGEQAATDPAQRSRMRQARLNVEGQRLDYLEAEKRRQAEEDARELAKLKDQARAHVHELEAKYNGDAKPATDAVPWWEGPHATGKIAGNLKQVDCLGKQARLIIEGDDHKTVKLLVTDPGKIVISGANQAQLGCGIQKARHVTIEYFPKADTRLATTGEVATIEFQ